MEGQSQRQHRLVYHAPVERDRRSLVIGEFTETKVSAHRYVESGVRARIVSVHRTPFYYHLHSGQYPWLGTNNNMAKLVAH